MPIYWHEIADYLAPIALGGVGALTTFVFLLPSKLGERLVSQYFEERVADLKHEQSKEMGKVQADLDHLKDRGTRSNEREYQAITQTWERFVEAFRATKAAIAQFIRHFDLGRMPEDDLKSFLDANEVPERSKTYILDAYDKNRAFSNYVRHKALNDAGSAIETVRDTLLKQSVFIPADLYQQFDAVVSRLHRAWVEQSMEDPYQNRGDQVDSMALIRSEGQSILETLRDAVRARLLRTT